MSHLRAVRQAVADYMEAEGCSCCRDSERHAVAQERLAKLLKVPKYSDGSGYNFAKFRTKEEPEMSEDVRKLAEELLDAISTERILELPSSEALEAEQKVAEQFLADALRKERLKMLEEVGKEIDTSTGPTGGWLDSPKAIFARIRALAGKP